jgi:serine/threonine protein kinase
MSVPLTAFDQPSGWPVGAGPGARTLPTHIGKYKVISRLGEGATSDVFLARDEFNQRNVAIKRVREAALLDDTETHYQTHFFAAEASLVGRLQHPNVVKIYDAVEDPQGPTW